MENDKPGKSIEKIFERIEKGDLKMRSCCFFVARSWLWLLVSATLFFAGAVFFSVIIRYVIVAEPATMIVERPLFFFSILPHVLIILAVLTLVFSALAYRKSRDFCRHENWLLLVFLFFGSILIGFSIHGARLDEKIVQKIENNGRMNSLVQTPIEFWSKPHRGTLSGIVGRISADDLSFDLISWDGRLWRVSSNQTNWGSPLIKERSPVKMIGRIDGETVFAAKKVFGWR